MTAVPAPVSSTAAGALSAFLRGVERRALVVAELQCGDAARAEHGPELRAIVGFRFQVEHVQLKLKLSQNHPDANQRAVIAELEQLGTPYSTELAQWMRWHREQATRSG